MLFSNHTKWYVALRTQSSYTIGCKYRPVDLQNGGQQLMESFWIYVPLYFIFSHSPQLHQKKNITKNITQTIMVGGQNCYASLTALEVLAVGRLCKWVTQRGGTARQGSDVLTTCHVCVPQLGDWKATQRRRKKNKKLSCTNCGDNATLRSYLASDQRTISFTAKQRL